jgi:ABC-type bacteriocin/lantibiotic exporter with double-glycine peptidase domain
MVLSGFNIDLREKELRELCDCTIFGTEALKAVDAARKLGFDNTVKSTLSMDELLAQVNCETYPIVFVNLLLIDQIRDTHAMVVIAVEESNILVYDPLKGERKIPRSTFESAWAMMHNISILVQV